ncbi:MAG: HEAT repeat domain-containing protein, partial [Candidatus Nanopelagicales bacterium]
MTVEDQEVRVTLADLVLVLGATAAVLAVAYAMVAMRKFRRDRREADKTQRRTRFRLGIAGSDAEQSAVLREATGHPGGQTDLVAVLMGQEFDPDSLRRLPDYPAFAADLTKRVGSRRPIQRGTAVLLLNMLRDPDGVADAAAAMSDKDADVRLVGARSLAIVGTPEAARALIGALRERRMAWERIVERLAAPWALSECLAALAAESARDRPDPIFRSNLMRTLGLIGSSEADPQLLELLRRGTVEERVNAARALGQAGTAECAVDLEKALTDPADVVRAQAATALG